MPVLSCLSLALALATPLPQAPPPETLNRMHQALGVMEGKGVTGTYRLKAHVNVHATGSDEPEDTVEIDEVTIAPDGTKTSRLISAIEDGRDVTAQRIAKGEGKETEKAEKSSEGKHAKREKGDGAEQGNIDMDLLPFGANASRYVFGPVREKDRLLIADFHPDEIKKGEDGEDFGKGQIAWDPVTGDPVWIEVTMAKKPMVISEFIIRFEFTKSGTLLYPSLVHTSTKSGIPLIFRLKLKLDLEMSEVHLTPTPVQAHGKTPAP